MTDRVIELLGDHGLYAVFLLMLVDAVLPAASELVMVYSGALAAGAFTSGVVLFGYEFDNGLGAWVAMVLAGTIGYTIGSVLGWAIGIYGGRPYLERHGRWLHLSPQKLARAERWFDRWGDWAVFMGRITPVARSFVSIPAGVFRAPLGRYTVFTFVGSTLWCVVFAAVGYAFGTRWETFHENFHYVDYAVVAGIVLGVAYLLVRRRRSSTLSRRADPAR
ncbi:MAG TPA: DedA family protein [Gaiellaceae bacterium]|nr:DedA family protein [Gaiellaceae bacterium]